MVVANATGAMMLLLFMITNGFAISANDIPPYLIWIYWLNPLAWALRALAVNELTAPRWGDTGNQIIETFGIPNGRDWIWGAALYLWGLNFVVGCLSSFILRITPSPAPQPTVSEEESKQALTQGLTDALMRQSIDVGGKGASTATAGVDSGTAGDGTTSTDGTAAAVPLSTLSTATTTTPTPTTADTTAAEVVTTVKGAVDTTTTTSPTPTTVTKKKENGDAASAVPFVPITLVCNNIKYYVPDPSGGVAPGVVKGGDDKEIEGTLQLLRGLSFYSRPGQLTALMVCCLCCSLRVLLVNERLHIMQPSTLTLSYNLLHQPPNKKTLTITINTLNRVDLVLVRLRSWTSSPAAKHKASSAVTFSSTVAPKTKTLGLVL